VNRLITARRTLAALALAPLLTTGVVACGDSDGDSGDAAATDSATPVAGAAGDELEAGDEVEPAEFIKTVTDGFEASTTAHLAMTMSAGAAGEMSAEGDVDYTSTPPDMAMTMTMPAAGGEMDIRMVDGIMYMSMGDLTQGKFWKLDPSDPKGPLAGLGMTGMLDQMDPAKALASMEGGISSVTFEGEDGGLDRYELTIDMQELLKSMKTDLPPAAEGDVPESITYDLWLDDEGRFSKMVMDDLPVAGSTGSLEMTVSGWGEEVSIEAPPADQVTPMPDMGQMMEDMTASGSA
jgi:hypothetical protein